VLQSNAAHSVISTPKNSISGVNVITCLGQMKLEDAKLGRKSVKCPKGSFTKVELNSFLWEVFTLMDNKDRKDKFIVPDTPFTTPLQLDKLMAV